MSHIYKPHAYPVGVYGCSKCCVGGTYYEVSDYEALERAFDTLEGSFDTLERDYCDLEYKHKKLEESYKELDESYKELEKSYNTLNISHKELETSYEYHDPFDVNDIKEDILTLRQIIKIHETTTGESMHVDEFLTQILDKLK